MARFNRKGALLVGAAAVMLAAVAGGLTGGVARPKIIVKKVDFVADFSDPRRAAGAAHNVFVGRVMRQGETVATPFVPRTMFTVQVLENIKGSLPGAVQVRQDGGFDADEQALILVQNDPLLEVGRTYLFATYHPPGADWHAPLVGYGDVPIRDERERAALVSKFTAAVRAEIPVAPQ